MILQILLSGNGTLRTILVLLVLWMLVRMWVRSQAPQQRPPGGAPWGGGEARPKGEVRIEPAARKGTGKDADRHLPDVEDAEFEEID